MITDYTSRKRKLEVQKEIYSNITKKIFVGLCGPNVIEYLDKINYKRFAKVILYETNKNVFNSIKSKLGNNYSNVTIFNDNINNNLGKTKAFYDLDYCKSFEDIREFMPKIAKIEEFSITVSFRPFGFPFKFFSNYLKHNNYIHYTYRDGTPMITILVKNN